ncbi:YggT family protein [Candidatus Anaplasma sp. TIGMIC]|uniref:YggT family protein n=1 Tax=Candidatus Anaplasma sp. TIGMIC TaxID=3020713 RepID=UPI00232EED66|nr:YggT family protein [Candidatus Anaplasma sp. TIGMIC]MDB1135049.1 YggT family protein [Candidatus Anaplasma sp. TIGMIC]
MHPIAYLIEMLLSAYNFALIAWVVLGWLISMRIVNRDNELVYRVFSALSRITGPAVTFIRRYVPGIAGLDLSPLILLIIISFFRYALRYYFG